MPSQEQKLSLYNCLSLIHAGRMRNICDSRLGDSATAFIQRTCQPDKSGTEVQDYGTHHFLSSGYRGTDRKAGTGISLNIFFIPMHSFRKIY